ncbi:MAG: hypothetical protein K2N70_07950 [Helicobacter sp.]|nr:hypothetical protein [Helicobacter sp.]
MTKPKSLRTLATTDRRSVAWHSLCDGRDGRRAESFELPSGFHLPFFSMILQQNARDNNF